MDIHMMTKSISIIDKTEIQLETKLNYTHHHSSCSAPKTVSMSFIYVLSPLSIPVYWETSHKLSDWPKLHCTVQLRCPIARLDSLINIMFSLACLLPPANATMLPRLQLASCRALPGRAPCICHLSLFFCSLYCCCTICTK